MFDALFDTSATGTWKDLISTLLKSYKAISSTPHQVGRKPSRYLGKLFMLTSMSDRGFIVSSSPCDHMMITSFSICQSAHSLVETLVISDVNRILRAWLNNDIQNVFLVPPLLFSISLFRILSTPSFLLSAQASMLILCAELSVQYCSLVNYYRLDLLLQIWNHLLRRMVPSGLRVIVLWRSILLLWMVGLTARWTWGYGIHLFFCCKLGDWQPKSLNASVKTKISVLGSGHCSPPLGIDTLLIDPSPGTILIDVQKWFIDK